MKLITTYKIKMLEYPTIFVMCIGYFFWLTAIYLRVYGNIHWLCTIPLSSLGVYTLFTPLHEAAHTNISSNKQLNYILGTIIVIPFFFSNFKSFKYIHLQHHAHTNKPIFDPDYFSRYGIISCIFTPVYYYYYYMTVMYKNNAVNNNIYYVVSICIFLYAMYLYTLFYHAVVLWIIPSMVGISVLSYLFDYLPHRNHTNTEKPTKMTDGCIDFNHKKGNTVISFLTCNQLTYHHVHHLFTKIPFYLYKTVWEENIDTIQDDFEYQTVIQ